VSSAERRADGGGVTVISRGYMGAGQRRCASRIAYQQAVVYAELGESAGDEPADPTGRSSYSQGSLGSDHDTSIKRER